MRFIIFLCFLFVIGCATPPRNTVERLLGPKKDEKVVNERIDYFPSMTLKLAKPVRKLEDAGEGFARYIKANFEREFPLDRWTKPRKWNQYYYSYVDRGDGEPIGFVYTRNGDDKISHVSLK